MPKQKAPKGAAPAGSEINDPRFSSFTTDPRFRLPSKKHTHTKLDSRFSRMLKDEDFSNSATVDRYGRKISVSGKKKALERLRRRRREGGKEAADVEVEDDDVVERELKRAEKYDPARGGGFSSSEDEDEEEEDEDDEGGVEIVEEEFPDMQAEAQAAAVEMGEVSSRIAVVNMDWDHIRSTDLMAVFSSFVRPGGKILKISIYPSEFGKERMEREEHEGPPREIFASKKGEEISDEDSEDDSDEEEEKIKRDLLKADEGKEFDSAALRQYQLERLRYYYAVVICSDNETAQNVYENTDGSEYLSSANIFDLRFIPDGTEFDDKPRDECESVPAGYRPIEFVTDALQHSKSKLTWDTNPEEASRKDAISKAFGGSRKDHLDNDLRAYLGSDSEESDVEEDAVAVEDDGPKLSKKEIARQKMRAALGLTDEPAPSTKKTKGPVGEMEVTFTAGLSAKGSTGVFENEPPIDETTAERYKRVEKERKARRKERAKAKREGRDPDASADGENTREAGKEDLGFDDPFFATEEGVKEKASKSIRKEERLKKREAKAAEAAAKESERAGLELLLQDDAHEEAAGADLEHFDINEIVRAEKRKRKKGGKKGKRGEGDLGESKRGGLQEGFEMDVADERFGALWGSHEFAIDPSHPKFVATEGMKKLLEEGRKKRARGDGDEDGDGELGAVVGGDGKRKKNKKRKVGEGEGEGKAEGGNGNGKGELSGLVERISRKVRK
ncbi:pre-rRNA-processing protein ESF1 [Drepanopeziza brunnea f. sp. 'multigermtubi' MB_m1]|uniref:Pre-rRNA-processing protein ESF1 n=1 Tax=Marssonina brunnea f. sp. multigermtubi (strain MB_m1) TaxID=1072389 RepID=K1WR49_MARBU|nr:pre-rRNA-processing protein ESF1 [Drepanopeziza brunnea f. sp. 'multigermtubi' MB_m1]EKD20100.1 pre-rRNA-processing protein ESF1 [Drepanopeziza brunnea f. sp. 'multigermtubi' MB_m1]